MLGLSNSCDFNKCEHEIERLQTQIDQYEEQQKLKDIIIEEFDNQLIMFDSRLDSVRVLELQIDSLTDVVKKRKRITSSENNLLNNMIRQIDELMTDNEALAYEIKAQIDSTAHGKINSATYTKVLIKSLKDKQEQIKKLEEKVKSLEKSIEGLKIEITYSIEKSEKLEQQLTQARVIIDSTANVLNAVYYTIGNRDQLVAKGIIEVKGVLKKVLELNPSFNEHDFNKINYKNVSLITISNSDRKAKDIEIVPSRAANLYEIRNIEGRVLLKILDAESFWKTSKYCVIVLK